jgi:hypothetical protein
MIKEADKHNSSKPNSMEEYGGFSLTAIRPVLAILTTLRGRDAQMATEVTEKAHSQTYRCSTVFISRNIFHTFPPFRSTRKKHLMEGVRNAVQDRVRR